MIGGAAGVHQDMIKKTVEEIDLLHDDGSLPARSKIDETMSLKNALGEYDPNTDHIGVLNGGSWPHMTSAHEIGHLLDFRALGINGQYASANHPDLQDLRDAIDASPTIKNIQGSWTISNKQYWLSRHEQFARSYAQYVATNSGNPTLLAELNKIRNSFQPWRQWPDAEFKPIAEAIDNMLKKKGWK